RLTRMDEADSQIAALNGIMRAELSQALNYPRRPNKVFLLQIHPLEVREQADYEHPKGDRSQLLRRGLKRHAGHLLNQIFAIGQGQLAASVERIEEDFLSIGTCHGHKMARETDAGNGEARPLADSHGHYRKGNRQ